MKRVVFGITDLSIGGAEKTLVDLCNALCNLYEITIFTIYGQGKLEKELNNKIKLISLYNSSYANLKLIHRRLISLKLFFMRKFIYKKNIQNKFDVEVAFLEGPITQLFSIKNKKIKKVAWIHTDISLIFGTGIKAKFKKILNKKIYTNYNNLIFVSQNSLDMFNKTYGINKNNQVIHNYINIDKIIEMSNEEISFSFDSSSINFLSVCRLVPSKAIDRLVRIHSQLLNDGFYHKMYIIGDGPEQNRLINLIKDLKVDDSFILLGAKTNPYPYMKICDYFCLLSHYEGFPMVLLEAKALNKTIIITNTSSQETIDDYNSKIILENSTQAIYEGLKQVILNGKTNTCNSVDNNNYNIEILNKIQNILGE